MQVRSGACPALLGRESTARSSEVVVGSGLEVTAKEQQGRRVNHEKGEGEMERSKTHTQTPFFHDTGAMRVCAHA